MKETPKSARFFIGLVALAGLSVLAGSLMHWASADHLRFASLLILAMLASRLKLSLPGVNGSMSVNLPFILIGVVELSFPEALVIGCLSTLVQCLPKPGKPMKPVQVMFNVGTLINAVALSYLACHQASAHWNVSAKSLLVVAASAAFFVADTLPVAAIISLTESRKVGRIWHEIFLLTFPYFVLSAGMAAIVVTATTYVGWQPPLFALPVMYAIYHSYSVYFGRRAEEKLAAEPVPAPVGADD